MAIAPPEIFSPVRRIAMRRRMLALQAAPGAPRYLIEDMIDDVLERTAFVRIEARRALVIGDFTGTLAAALSAKDIAVIAAEPAAGFDEEQPYPAATFDLVISLGTLDTVNDLPGALIHIRHALAPGGMMLASFAGAGSLPRLRAAMAAGDGLRAAPRIHPQIDVRAGAQLLQRAGLADPVADSRTLTVRFGSFRRLVADLRTQGLSNVPRAARPTTLRGCAGTSRGGIHARIARRACARTIRDHYVKRLAAFALAQGRLCRREPCDRHPER